LPRKYQGQAAAQMWKGAVKPVFEDGPIATNDPGMAAKAVSLPVAPLRQKAGDGLNKLERAFLGHLRAICEGSGAQIYPQSITLKLANGCRFTVDFVAAAGRLPEMSMCKAYEVKGFMRDDAAVKLKVAASLYPWIAFHLVTRKKGVWQITPVLP
jgi:hypothetical protein